MSIDGSTGNVYIGQIPTEPAQITGDFEIVMGWADEVRKLKVRTNADNEPDAARHRIRRRGNRTDENGAHVL